MNLKNSLLLMAATVCGMSANAQLSTNPDKFLGNITTSYNVDYGNTPFYKMWNQITCENESKWASVEGTNNQFNWGGSDNAYNYAKSHGFPFKFHALVWGAQYPKWLESQTPDQRYNEIVQWYDAVKAKYPDLQLIDVVNEAIKGHQAGTPYFIEALGGTGKTGYDWLIKAFELAYERWPNAILIYNDFNTFQWNTEEYIDIVKTLRDAGAPIDAYGCQSHDLTDCSKEHFYQVMDRLQNTLKMPMYSTEYDIGTDDDQLQLQRYQEQIPYMWEKDYVAGVTLWGYIYGRTWTTNGNSGIIKDGVERPAMKWLREYMQSDVAKNAKSPFPKMKKEASLYIKPEAIRVEKDKPFKISVEASLATKRLRSVQLYANDELIETFTEQPFETYYTPTNEGTVMFKAIAVCPGSTRFERYSEVQVVPPRGPFKGTPAAIPGVIEAENFDIGAEGEAFHDANSNQEGDAGSYRSDITGVDVVKGGSGYAVGYGQVGEWMEYTVDVKEDGYYNYNISYSAPEAAAFSISLSEDGNLTPLTAEKEYLIKSSAWATYRSSVGQLTKPLKAGKQVIRVAITDGTGTYVANIDKITFTKANVNEDIKVNVVSNPAVVHMASKVTLTAEVDSPVEIKNVKFYVNGNSSPVYTDSSAPFQYSVTPREVRDYYFRIVTTDVNDNEAVSTRYVMTVNPTRKPYNGTAISLPGTIEAENFDVCGEGLTFHDTDTKDEGEAGYRTDNGGIDIRKTDAGAYVIGWTRVGEWMEYTVNVTEHGYYSCEAIVASGTTGSGIKVSLVEDGNITDLWSFAAPQTGSNTWENFVGCKAENTVELTPGKHVIRITVTGADCDIDKLNIKIEATDAPTVEEEVKTPQSHLIYNEAGQQVTKAYRGRVIQNGKHFIKR